MTYLFQLRFTSRPPAGPACPAGPARPAAGPFRPRLPAADWRSGLRAGTGV